MDSFLSNKLPVYIVSKDGIKERSTIRLSEHDPNSETYLIWREEDNSKKFLSCNISEAKLISYPVLIGNSFKSLLDSLNSTVTSSTSTKTSSDSSSSASTSLSTLSTSNSTSYKSSLISIHFSQTVLNFEFFHEEFIPSDDQNLPNKIVQIFNELKQAWNHSIYIKNTKKLEKNSIELFNNYENSISLYEEDNIKLLKLLKLKESFFIIEKNLLNYKLKLYANSFKHWVNVIKELNKDKMLQDRQRWRLHAAANLDKDLQAWYHTLFYRQVYRLRGPIWYKDATLPSYKLNYNQFVENTLNPSEEAALSHILCSPDTTYGDVAGQMFTVQSILSPNEFKLFQLLATYGSTIIKHPRSGRPAKKNFRISFVEGNIFLTWKGKFGNQGVAMNEIKEIVGGINTEILKWSGNQNKADQYLSIICIDRSIDLFFESVEERNNWMAVLKALVQKEQGKLCLDDEAALEEEKEDSKMDQNFLHELSENFENYVLYDEFSRK